MADDIPDISQRRWQQKLLLQQSVNNTVESSATQPLETTWAKFAERLTTDPGDNGVTLATFLEYKSKKSTAHKATTLKASNGWYVKGPLDVELKKQRDKGRMPYRVDIITLDFDRPPLLWPDLLAEAFPDFAWVAHTTASHTDDSPKVRLIAPLDEPITLAESEALTHHLFSMTCPFGTGESAWWHGLSESIRPGQPMFYPTRCIDQTFRSISHDGEHVTWLNGSKLLQETYPDQGWEDRRNWVQVPAEFKAKREQEALRETQDALPRTGSDNTLEDVFEKQGVVGAICQCYSIERMFDELFRSEYERGSCSTRYTYIDGSSVDGVWLVDPHDKLGGEHTACLIYHDSDPMRGDKPINAYDFIRLKLYGHLSAAEQKTKMREWCDSHDDCRAARYGMGAPPPRVEGQYADKVRRTERDAGSDVQGDAPATKPDYSDKVRRPETAETHVSPQATATAYDPGHVFHEDWLDQDDHNPDDEDEGTHAHWIWDKLAYSKADTPKLTQSEANRLCIQRYSREWNSFHRDTFTDKLMCTRSCRVGYTDYIKGDVCNPVEVAQALVAHAESTWGNGVVSLSRWVPSVIEWLGRESPRSPDAMRDWLESLPPWDGKERVKHIFSRFLGAEPNKYHQIVANLMMMGLIARQMKPGCSFDYCVVFASTKEGIGKSSLVKQLVPDQSWFNESMSWSDLSQSKKVIEELGGVAVVEVGEMIQFKRDADRNKNAVSRVSDNARTAYSRVSTQRLRRFILIGSTNDETFLGSGDNRRYLPVIGRRNTLLTATERREIGELRDLWAAEALHKYRAGEFDLLLKDQDFWTALREVRSEAQEESLVDEQAEMEQALERCANGAKGTPAVKTCALEVFDQLYRDAIPQNSDANRFSDTAEGRRIRPREIRRIASLLRQMGYKTNGTKIKANHPRLYPAYTGQRLYIKE